MQCWEKKVALITDCDDEVGVEIINKLAKSGMTVIAFGKTNHIIDKRAESFKELDSKKIIGKVILCKCDITNVVQLREAFDNIEKEYGGVDVLVNNACCISDCLISDGKLEDFRKVIDANIYALVACTRLAAQSMIDRKSRGHIINLNDLCTYEIPEDSKKNVFIASKCAITSVNEILRVEFRYLKANIKVTNIVCGKIESKTEPSLPEPILKLKDIAKLVKLILNTPEHFQVHEVILDSTLA